MGAVKLVTQSGSITLEGEDTAGASTVVIPKAGVGKVLQVVEAVLTTPVSIASVNTNNFFDIAGLSVSITPKSTNSKILVFYTVNITSNGGGAMIKLVRDSSDIFVGDAEGDRIQVSGIHRDASAVYSVGIENLSGQFLDSPNTLAEIEYKIQTTLGGAYNNNIYVNRTATDSNFNYMSRAASSITLMEIGA